MVTYTPPIPVVSSIRRPLFLLAIALFGFMPGTQAAVSFILQVNGISGGSTAAGYTGGMDCSGFTWGVTNVTSSTGTGRATFNDLIVQKFVDKASPPLALAVASGTLYTDAHLTVLSTSGGGSSPLYKIDLNNVSISAVSPSGTSNLTETVSLRYTQIRWTYNQQNPDGSLTPVSAGWDLSASRPW